MLPDIIDVSRSNKEYARTIEARLNQLYEHLLGPQPVDGASKAEKEHEPYGAFTVVYETELKTQEILRACGYMLDNIERVVTSPVALETPIALRNT